MHVRGVLLVLAGSFALLAWGPVQAMSDELQQALGAQVLTDADSNSAEKSSDAKPTKQDDKSSDSQKSEKSSGGDSTANSPDEPDEKTKTDSKTSEKSADKSADKAEEKKADDKKTSATKKPATYKVRAKKLQIDVESDGVFVADQMEEVALRPEVWSSFKVLEVKQHGAQVRKGDVLVRFDSTDIDEAISDKSLDERLGEVALMEAEDEFPRLQKSVELNLVQAQRDYDDIVDEYERFKKTMRPLSEKMAEYNLKQVQQYLDNAQEELDQLQKMYDADELTEETEEIVLKRQRFEVEYAKFYLEYAKINRDYTMDVSIPQRDLALQTSVDKTKLMLEEAKTAKSLGLSKKRYELEALRERRARSVENHAKLVADKALMTLRAPRDGVVYYGRCVDGRWGEVSSYQSKLIPSGSISPNAVLMTVVSERPLRIETSIGEKDLPSVAAGQTVTLSPAADSEMELTAKVKSVESIPRGGNQFTVEIELGKDELAEWLKAGMTCKANIRVYEKDDAVVIPADLVQSEEDSPKNKYVMVQVKGEKEPQRRDLKIGKKKDKEVEVLKGLQPGDLIVKGAKDDQDKDDDDE